MSHLTDFERLAVPHMGAAYNLAFWLVRSQPPYTNRKVGERHRFRFIQEANVLSTLEQRPNLMDLTPTEFESLITNLFQKMGLETGLTQPSRDGGVDCVAFDQRPILGGKVIIQAKR